MPRKVGNRYYSKTSMLAIDPEELSRKRVALGKSQVAFAEMVGVNVAVIRRSEQGREPIREDGAETIAKFYKEPVEKLFKDSKRSKAAKPEPIPSASPDAGGQGTFDGRHKYTWEQMKDASCDVGERLFKNDFRPDIVLTFPGPSMIFAGVTLAMALSKEEFINIPVYTIVFAKKDVPAKAYPDFEMVETSTGRFNLFVPKALSPNGRSKEEGDLIRSRRIAVIDDTIISGISMNVLKTYFTGLGYRPKNIKFACWICLATQTKFPETRPLTGAFSRGRSRRYPYYVCQTAQCPKSGKSHAAAVVHQEFEGLLDFVAPEPAIMDEVRDRIVAEVQEHRAELAARATNKKRRAEQLDRELQGLIRMSAQGLITEQEFLRQRRTIADQHAALEGRASWLSIDVSEVREKFTEIATPLVQLRETWETIGPPFRRRFERLILPAGFEIGKSRTAELGGLFSFLRTFTNPNSSVVSHVLADSNPILPEILGFWDVFKMVEEEKRTPRWRFRCSHRNRPST